MHDHLRQLKTALSPSEEARRQMRERTFRRLLPPAHLLHVARDILPSSLQKKLLWERILARIATPVSLTLFARVRALLALDSIEGLQRGERLFPRLQPAPVRVGWRVSRWTAAVAVLFLLLRLSPMLFLAPRTVARSAVIVLPTRGGVALSIQGLWQPIRAETELKEGAQISTTNGEATVLFHDDGTVRLAPGTRITIHDVTDRPEPALPGPTLTLHAGEIWVQGLLPSTLRGIVIMTAGGPVTVHGGSFSIASGDETDVRVWDRSVAVGEGQKEMVLVAGQRARLTDEDEALRIRAIAPQEYEEAWVAQNLRRDAVHREEIAQEQLERQAARAGILPTSPFYPVKRVAEKVDMLFTLDRTTRVQKKLERATTRLDEAAALIAGGASGAQLQLQEYKQTLIEVASSSGSDSVTQFMVTQSIAENAAQIAAVLPDDETYVLKMTVLEASASIPLASVDARDVEGVLLVDTLDVLRQAIAEGDRARAEEAYDALTPYLAQLQEGEEDDRIKPEVRKEALSLLSDAAVLLEEQSESGGTLTGTVLEAQLEPFLPPRTRPEPVPLSDEQINVLVDAMRARIFVFENPRPRWNQLQHEMRLIHGHPDEGRILRRLYYALPENGLARYVRAAIQQLREEKKGE